MRRKKGTKLVAAILVIIMLFGLVGAGIMPLADEKNSTDGIAVDSGEVTISEMTAKLVFVKNEQSEPDPAEENPGEENPGEENPGEENPGEENPGEENPGEENPGEEAPGEAEGEDAEITEIALTYKDNKLLVEDKDVKTLKAWLDEGSVYLQVTAKAKDYYDYTNVNETNPNGQLVDDKLIALEKGQLRYGTLKIEFAALPTATITITGDLDARDGCSVKGYKENAEGKVVITATKDTVIELVPGFEFTSISKAIVTENGEEAYEYGSMAKAIASISGNEQITAITAVVKKTDNEAPTFDATVNTQKVNKETVRTLVINNVKDKLFENGEELSVVDGEVDVKVYVNEKEVTLTNGEYSRKLNNKEVVAVKAIDAAGNSYSENAGAIISVTTETSENKDSCTVTVTFNSDLEAVVWATKTRTTQYKLVLCKNGEEMAQIGDVITLPKDGKTSDRPDPVTCTIANDEDYDSNAEYTVELQKRWKVKKYYDWTTKQETAELELGIDAIAPTVEAKSVKPESSNLGYLNSLTIGIGENAGQIWVMDNAEGSGIATVGCKIYYTEEYTDTVKKEDGSTETVKKERRVYVVGGEEKKDDNGKVTDDGFGKFINEATFTVVDFKQHKIDGKDLKIEVYAVDKAGNQSKTKEYTATVDTTPPKITCQVNCVGKCSNDNNDGYYHNVARTATITVKDDHLSGGEVIIGVDGDEFPVTFSIENGKLNFSDLQKSNITFSECEDSNVADGTIKFKITFSGDGVYLIKEIKAYDLAENEAPKPENLGGEFEIDTTAPKIGNVKFECAKDKNEKPCSNTKDGYHSAARTATITVSDKNLSSGTVTIVKNGDTENPITITVDIDSKGKLSLSDSGNGISVDDNVITFSGDGKYQITEIVVRDLAGNTTKVKNDNDDGKKMLGGEFVIDTHNPIVKVSYTESKGAENGKYYNVIRTATISVTEANFEKEIHVVKNFDGDECKKPGVYVVINLGEGDAENVIKNPIFNVKKSIENAEWTDEGEKHTITVTYDANKAYTFDIKVVDQALRSNQLATDISTDKDFVIDKDIVAPVISGVSEGAAYPDECVPTITFTDANYASGEVRIYQTRDGQINRDVTSKFGTGINTNGTGGVSVINTIAKVPENDGIYTIVARMTDMAGNSSESRVTFSVNRFGSVYKLGDEIANLRDSYVRSVKNDLVLTEINPDMLIAGSAKVSITRNGKPIDVIFDVAPNPDKNAAAIGSSGWYEYIYTISAKNFEKDGAYVITVSSTDEAGNNSSTTSYEECSMEFKVDSTKPEFTSLVGLEKAIINAESAPVTFGVHDAIGISNITLYCDGKVIASFESKDIADVNNFEGKFVVPEGSNQVVRIVVVDLAGNVTDTEKLIATDELPEFMENIQDITVSTNFFVRWFANKLVFFGSIIGVIAVGAAAWWFLFGKKRSKSETNS